MVITDLRMTLYGLNGEEDAAAAVEDALRCLPGVVHVAVDLAAAQAHIWYDQSQVLPSMRSAAVVRGLCRLEIVRVRITNE
ncbi:MAG: hypothetical protein JWO42_1580 [Chloroflexi bacterium]|jgi:hypothetical protein|nr:hypothetical protein [Chloroflexota bacterium]